MVDGGTYNNDNNDNNPNSELRFAFAYHSTEKLKQLLHPVQLPSNHPRAIFRNWGKTYRCKPRAVFVPETEEQCKLIIELARRERTTVRACGAGHSPSDLACTSGYLLRTDKLDRVREVNVEKNFVVAQAGISLQVLHERLREHGLAMCNVGSISDQSLGGVITTATHGSGVDYAVIPSHVLELTLLIADGSRVTCSLHERQDLFLATLSGLGTTGLVLEVKLSVEPAFNLKEIRNVVDVDDGLAQFESIAKSAEHVRIWWFPRQRVWRVMASSRTNEVPNVTSSWFWDELIGFHLVQLLLFGGRFWSYLTVLASQIACALMSGSTTVVDTSYKIFNLDCRYPQYTTEWAIPYEHSRDCLRELDTWLSREFFLSTSTSDDDGDGGPGQQKQHQQPHFPIEIRFTKPDDIWLSPSYGRKTTWIGLVQYKPYNYPVPYRRYFQGFVDIVMKYNGRPHWAKDHSFRSEGLRELYPRFDEFMNLIRETDPHGIFRNEYVQRHFFDMNVNARVFKERP